MDEKFYYERIPHYYETDQMGIIHHSNYIRWFEEARIQLLENYNLDYKTLEQLGILIPVLQVSCQYKQYITSEECDLSYKGNVGNKVVIPARSLVTLVSEMK